MGARPSWRPVTASLVGQGLGRSDQLGDAAAERSARSLPERRLLRAARAPVPRRPGRLTGASPQHREGTAASEGSSVRAGSPHPRDCPVAWRGSCESTPGHRAERSRLRPRSRTWTHARPRPRPGGHHGSAVGPRPPSEDSGGSALGGHRAARHALHPGPAGRPDRISRTVRGRPRRSASQDPRPKHEPAGHARSGSRGPPTSERRD